MSIRINIGCGQTPTEGWENYDNSVGLLLSKIPIISSVATRSGLLSQSQAEFVNFARISNIKWADATKKIPQKDNTVEVIYSSHMLEHLDKYECATFLKEAKRVLIHGGIIRLALPDLRFHIDNYLKEKNADKFIEETMLTKNKPRTLLEQIKELIIGDRHHMWMYDRDSLCRLLISSGFKDPQVLEPGSTLITNPGPLDLEERSPESVFVEAINP